MKYLTLLLVLSLSWAMLCCAYPAQQEHEMKLDSSLDSEWKAFKLSFNKRYDEAFEFVRRSIWEKNLRSIQRHNLEHDMGHHTYTLGINEFADLTQEEFAAKYLSALKQRNDNTTRGVYLPPLNVETLPDVVDWRTKGYVTAIKNQEQCGSCWAFSTTGSLEGQYFRTHGTLVSFSEQQLVDCSRSYGNYGCNGGLMDFAFQYIRDYGIERETDYPYTAMDGSCKYDSSRVVTKLSSYTDIKQYNEADLKSAVATIGPVSVAIDASRLSFQFYKNGVYNEPACSQTQLDHGVLAVGYGHDASGGDYWLVKNSWGLSWGLSGYIKMSRNRQNQCGIATAASYPTI